MRLEARGRGERIIEIIGIGRNKGEVQVSYKAFHSSTGYNLTLT